MSRRFIARPVHGLLLLDKEVGYSSNSAVQRAKRIFCAQKVGHTGSLDPIATGVLPLCFGEATKLSGFLLDTDKRYQVRVRLGQTTTTADIEGEVVDTRRIPDLSVDVIEAHLSAFRGPLSQIPPMYSALKHQGQRLYELARKGVNLELQPRSITIHQLSLLGFGENFIDLDVHCSKGTYIRSLAVDLGEAIGCGGHVETLRRTAVGHFAIANAITITELESLSELERQNRLLPVDALVDGLPQISLSMEVATKFRHGQAVDPEAPPFPGPIKVYDDAGRFLGLGEYGETARLHPKRVLCTHELSET